jgi:hypothetical protein
VVCPELQDPQLDNSLLSLVEKVISGRENLGVTFPTDVQQEVRQKPVADKSFKVMRSCLLLSFCWAVIQVYKTYTEEGDNPSEEKKETEGDGSCEQSEMETKDTTM